MLSNETAPSGDTGSASYNALCSVCAHPKRSEIDRFLIQYSVRRAAARFGLSKSALHRHRDRHIAELLAAGERVLGRGLALAAPQLRARLEQLHLDTMDFFRATSGIDNAAAARTLGILTRQIEVGIRVAAVAPAGPAVGPDAIDVFSRAVLEAVAPHPEVRDRVVASLRRAEEELGWTIPSVDQAA